MGPDRRAMAIWPVKWMPIWMTSLCMSLLEFEECTEVGHVDAHQNSLPGSEGDENQYADIPMYLLKVHKMSGYGGTATM